jgi:hypothetical protein
LSLELQEQRQVVHTSSSQVLLSRGYVHVRSGFTMRKDLESDEDARAPLAGVRIRRYEEADERVLYEVASFAENWGFCRRPWRDSTRICTAERDPSMVFLAQASGTTVGYVVSFLLRCADTWATSAS